MAMHMLDLGPIVYLGDVCNRTSIVWICKSKSVNMIIILGSLELTLLLGTNNN